jgi:hypothetical protein
MLFDVNVNPDGEVGHQHIDFVYFGAVGGRVIDPAGDDEAAAGEWEWFTREDLRAFSELETEVEALGVDAIEAVESRPA